MAILTSQELGLLRTQPHLTKLHLSIYKPQATLMAQVNDASIAKGEQQITYDGVLTGTASGADVEPGSTMLVGSSPGANDKGSIYIYYPSIGNSFINVGENDHINWEDDDYITCINQFEIVPRYPSYELDGDGNLITVKKAWDVEYDAQNTNLGQFICMGQHYANFMDGDPDGDTATHDIYFTATGTTNFNGDGMTYEWWFDGATITGSSSETPGWVTWNSPGHYFVRLIVTSSSGEKSRSVRTISLYNRFDQGSNYPIQSWGLDSLSGNRAEGGYRAKIWVKENVEDVVDGAVVVLFYENWYGDTKQNIAHNAENRDHIFFMGYIQGHTIEYDYQTSTVYFEVVSPTEIMKQGEAFSVSLEDSGDPVASANDFGGSPWFFLDGLSVKTAIWHYLRWHSSVNFTNDVQFNMNDIGIHYFDADRTSLYDAVQGLMESAVFGRVLCDRQGKIWFERDYEAINNITSSMVTEMTLDGDDWIGTPFINERVVNEYSYIQCGGLSYTRGVEDVAYLSGAPGDTPAYKGGKLIHEGLAIDSQATLNTLTGNIFAFRNSRFPEVVIPLSGNYSNFDIAPHRLVQLYLNHTFRNLNWEGKHFCIEEVSWEYNPEVGSLKPTLLVSEATQGFAGDTIPIPEVPPTEGQDVDPIEIPQIPSLPPFEIPTIDGGYSSGDKLYILPTVAFTDGWGTVDYATQNYYPYFKAESTDTDSDFYGGIWINAYSGNIQVSPIFRNSTTFSNDVLHYVSINVRAISTPTSSFVSDPPSSYATTTLPSTLTSELTLGSEAQAEVTLPGYPTFLAVVSYVSSSDFDFYLYGWEITFV